MDLISAAEGNPELRKTKLRGLSSYIRVHDGGNRIFLLPADECETWFASSVLPLNLAPSDALSGIHFEVNRTRVRGGRGLPGL